MPAFLADFPSLHALAATDESRLAERLATLGLQNRRATRLVGLARALLARDGRLPDSKAELESLPGVGPYVAAAYMVHGPPRARADGRREHGTGD